MEDLQHLCETILNEEIAKNHDRLSSDTAIKAMMKLANKIADHSASIPLFENGEEKLWEIIELRKNDLSYWKQLDIHKFSSEEEAKRYRDALIATSSNPNIKYEVFKRVSLYDDTKT